jgi:hypothetical protein
VHGDSTVSGHGPGVTPLLTGPAALLRPQHAPRANLAAIFAVREPAPPRIEPTLTERDRRRPCLARELPPGLAFATAQPGPE